MASLNKIMIIGNLGKDPEIRETSGGTKVCNFTIATTETFGTGNEKKELTEWHNVVAWKQLAEVLHKYAHKGDKLFVEGRIATRKWEDKNGETRYTTEIQAANVVFLTPKAPSTDKLERKEESPKRSDDDFPF